MPRNASCTRNGDDVCHASSAKAGKKCQESPGSIPRQSSICAARDCDLIWRWTAPDRARGVSAVEEDNETLLNSTAAYTGSSRNSLGAQKAPHISWRSCGHDRHICCVGRNALGVALGSGRLWLRRQSACCFEVTDGTAAAEIFRKHFSMSCH